MENNQISISGNVIADAKFSHENHGENFYLFTIECYRTSGAFDTINVIVSDRLVDVSNLKGKVVFIEGSIRTHNDNGHLITSVFADEIEEIFVEPDIERVDMNEVSLSGFICKKNPLRTSPGGRIICDFIIAINRQYGKSDYIPIVSWGRNAKYIDELPIGTQINIQGRLQSRIYVKNDVEHFAYEVSLQNIETY